jgi:tetratricopeptide (TPR) repeat protein
MLLYTFVSLSMQKPIKFLTLMLVMSVLTTRLSAQNKDDSKSLVKQGIVLNDAGKYPEAIEKYKQALVADPDNLQADYELAFTLYNAGKGQQSIPYLETIIKSNGAKSETYDLLGSIYDDSNEPDKAIEAYSNGIADNPNYERLHFNIGISYYRQRKYAKAESAEVDAIKLDQKHASSQRIYAMVNYDEGKRICALMAWCSFLLLEPQTERSAEAFRNIKKVLNYGITKKDSTHTNINISTADIGSTNFALSLTILAATEGKKNLSSVDSLTLQLTSIFKSAHEYTESTKDVFFANFYAKFFAQLADSGNMEAFVRLISLSAYKAETLAWVKDNGGKLSDLDLWVRNTQRGF